MKERRISIRISEEDFTKIRGLRNGKSMTEFFRELIIEKVKASRGEAQSFNEMIRKIDSSDISKLVESVEQVKTKVDELMPQVWGQVKEIKKLVWEEKEGKPEGVSAIDYLNVIHKMGQETHKKVKDLSAKESGPDNFSKEIIEKLRQQDVNFAHYISQILTEIQNLKR